MHSDDEAVLALVVLISVFGLIELILLGFLWYWRWKTMLLPMTLFFSTAFLYLWQTISLALQYSGFPSWSTILVVRLSTSCIIEVRRTSYLCCITDGIEGSSAVVVLPCDAVREPCRPDLKKREIHVDTQGTIDTVRGSHDRYCECTAVVRNFKATLPEQTVTGRLVHFTGSNGHQSIHAEQIYEVDGEETVAVHSMLLYIGVMAGHFFDTGHP